MVEKREKNCGKMMGNYGQNLWELGNMMGNKMGNDNHI
jgi:hypothetical protein